MIANETTEFFLRLYHKKFFVATVAPTTFNRCFLGFSTYATDSVLPAKSKISWEPNVPVVLRMGHEEPDNWEPVLVQTMFRRTVEMAPNHLALVGRADTNGRRTKWTYQEYFDDVTSAANAFIVLGLERFNSVGIMGHNCPQWFIANVASIFAGGLSCGLYSTNSPKLVSYIANHAPISIMVCENYSLYQKVLGGQSLEEALPGVKKVILMEGKTYHEKNVIDWNQFIQLGRLQGNEVLEKVNSEIAINQGCLLIYTSGTTGNPKGALLSHDNVTYFSSVSMKHYSWYPFKEVLLSYLPLSHVAANMIDCFVTMYAGGTVYFSDKNVLKGSLVDNLRDVRPTRFLAVPRVWEKIQEKMEIVAHKSSLFKRAIANWAKAVSTKHHRLVREGKISEENAGIQMKLARMLVFSKVHIALGLDRVIQASSGGAALCENTLKYFISLDIPIAELLGMTETSGSQTTNIKGTGTKIGTVGRSCLGIRNKIYQPNEAGVGEIISTGRSVFMEYIHDEKTTRASFIDSEWFRSGDQGFVDAEGFYSVTGRIKELLITSGGENISPIPIEEAIKSKLSDVVSNVVVICDRRKYLSVLITLKTRLDPDTNLPTQYLEECVTLWCKNRFGLPEILTVDEFLAQMDIFGPVIKMGIDEANLRAISNAQKVHAFTVLRTQFSVMTGELGPTLKLKRNFVAKKYADEIDKMYNNA